MSRILHIETSGAACSVAISENNQSLAEKIVNTERSHASELGQMIQQILLETKLVADDLQAVAVSAGPGSYTGLRIGVSVAKAICYASELPLITIPKLEIMLTHLLFDAKNKGITPNESDLFVPMIDARRMEVYTCIFDSNLKTFNKTSAKIIDKLSFHDLLETHRMVFFGDGSEKCQNEIQHENAIFINGIIPEAKYMVGIAHNKYDKKEFVDLAYYEPFYLKEFQATTPKNILNIQ
jgi:tRNA threonylcarbamoyladenosine biosynthesis protein TsaB